MHYKKKHCRQQMMMVSYDSMIGHDNPVRLIDLLVKKYLMDNEGKFSWKGNQKRGSRSYPPETFLSLFIYGYFNGIASSRKLERESCRNIEVIWLLEGFQPDHWVICKFRRNNKELLRHFTLEFRRFLKEESYLTGRSIVFDGSKMKAYASREMFTENQLENKLENIEKELSDYLGKLENNDSLENNLNQAHDEINKLNKKIASLEKAKEDLNTCKTQLNKSNKKRISPNDQDATLVKGRDGKFAGYNVQMGVDPKHHMIVSGEVTTEANDSNLLSRCVETASTEIGEYPEKVIADKGYCNLSQILDLEQRGIECFIPTIQTHREKEEDEKGLFFQYHPNRDIYICPQEQELTLISRNQRKNHHIYNVYQCKTCGDCPVKSQCTTSQTGRIIKRNVLYPQIDSYRKKMKTEQAKRWIQKRKEVVEHPFGTIKMLMGKFNFLLTGTEKVQIEIDLYTTAYNLKRMLKIDTIANLKEKILSYNWGLV